jgi:hypothetical protein
MDQSHGLPALSAIKTMTVAPARHVRIQITKNSKGYQHETTVSLDWMDDELDWRSALAEMNRNADQLARAEIGQREAADRGELFPDYPERPPDDDTPF